MKCVGVKRCPQNTDAIPETCQYAQWLDDNLVRCGYYMAKNEEVVYVEDECFSC